MVEPLSAAEVTYKAIQELTAERELQIFEPEESDLYSTSIWAINLLTETDILDSTFPSDEAIMKVMNLIEKPWETNHHRSYFLPSQDSQTVIKVDPTIERNFHRYKDTMNMHNVYAEGNMSNISQTIPVNISKKPRIIKKHIHQSRLYR